MAIPDLAIPLADAPILDPIVTGGVPGWLFVVGVLAAAVAALLYILHRRGILFAAKRKEEDKTEENN